jgi:hypothetical protein
VHRSALFAAGLVLFVVTLLVNAVARAVVARGTSGGRPRGRRLLGTRRPQAGSYAEIVTSEGGAG